VELIVGRGDAVRVLNYGRAVMVLGIATMIASQVLPFWTQSQVLTISGPQVEFTGTRNYWIDIRITPPIKSGSKIKVTLASARPGSAAILIFPSTPDGDMKGPSLLSEVLERTVNKSTWSLTATQDSNYMVVVTSWNSTYVLEVESTWSPFHETKTALLVGFAVAFGGMLFEYYQRMLREQREKWGQHSSARFLNDD